MVLRTLMLDQFRSYEHAEFQFRDDVNVIIGPNGVGKTNLLEAVHAVAQGSSFRVGDRQLVQHDREWFRIDASFEDHERSLTYSTEQLPAKKLYVNGALKKRLTREVRLPVVLFEPETLRMLTGSPARRRAYLDTLLAQWYEDGAGLLRRYERVLAQRNNLLRSAHNLSREQLDDQLFPWDVSLAELASVIEERRRAISERLNETLSDEYSRIAQKTSTLTLHYIASHAHSQTAYLLQALQAHRHLDIARAHTTIGPHRSDFSMQLEHQMAETTASRGEQRSIVLALKFIELNHVIQLTNRHPLLLLDDVMSELDKTRQQQLLSVARRPQVIMTTIGVEALPKKTKAHVIKLT